MHGATKTEGLPEDSPVIRNRRALLTYTPERSGYRIFI